MGAQKERRPFGRAGQVREHVCGLGLAHLDARVHAHPDGPGVRLLGKRLTELVRERECGHLDRADERRLDRPFVPGRSVVEDDDRGCSRHDRISHLLGEEAAPAPDERDRPGVEVVEVRGIAAARLGIRIDRLEGSLDLAATGVAKRDEIVGVPVGERIRGDAGELGRGELVRVRVTNGLQMRRVARLA